MGDAHPDALAWGMYEGEETLTWLEVESGKKACERIIEDITHRYERAFAIAEAYDLQIIFVVLAQPWVLRALQDGIQFSVSSNMAIIFENWRNIGYLFRPIFGNHNSMMEDQDYPYIQNITKMFKKKPDFLISKLLSRVGLQSLYEELGFDG